MCQRQSRSQAMRLDAGWRPATAASARPGTRWPMANSRAARRPEPAAHRPAAPTPAPALDGGPSLAGARRRVAGRDHAQAVDAAPVGARHPDFKAVDIHRLAATRHVPELLHDQTRDRVELLCRQPRPEELIEFIDARRALHQVLALAVRADADIVFDVKLIVDVAHDLFDDILNRDQAGHAAVLIHHYGHVIAVAAKF